LDRPIEIEHGEQTLANLGAYILALPEMPYCQELWHAAAKTVLEALRSSHTARVALVFRLAATMSGQRRAVGAW